MTICWHFVTINSGSCPLCRQRKISLSIQYYLKAKSCPDWCGSLTNSLSVLSEICPMGQPNHPGRTGAGKKLPALSSLWARVSTTVQVQEWSQHKWMLADRRTMHVPKWKFREWCWKSLATTLTSAITSVALPSHNNFRSFWPYKSSPWKLTSFFKHCP